MLGVICDMETDVSDHQDLIGFQLSPWNRVLFLFAALWMVGCSGAGLLMAALSGVSCQIIGAAAMVFALVLAFAILFLRTGVYRLIATPYELRVTTMTGRRETIRWGEVRSLKSYHSEALLRAEGHRLLNLFIPPEEQNKLAAILREKTEARVIGLD